MTRTGFVELPRYPVVLLEGAEHNVVMINVLVEIQFSLSWVRSTKVQTRPVFHPLVVTLVRSFNSWRNSSNFTCLLRIYSTSMAQSWMFEIATYHKFEHLDIIQWLSNHGANVRVRETDGWTLLHVAARFGKLESLLEHNADINSWDNKGETPLLGALFNMSFSETGKVAAAMQLLLEYDADPNACDHNHSTPLHKASSRGATELWRECG